jgi:NADH-quinone oxidoreductase subunit G
MAAEAEIVIGIGMFQESFRGIADLVLPGTSYLERDGTTINLEGRLQRQRRAVLAPVPDVLAWLAKLAARFDVELSPYASNVFDEISDKCFGGISYTDIGEKAELPPPAARATSAERTNAPEEKSAPARSAQALRLVAYRPLFSGPAVDRTPELQFQRLSGDVQISREDAKARGIRHGQKVTVSSNGTSVELRAQVARDLAAGTVRIAAPDAGDLHATVEVN